MQGRWQIVVNSYKTPTAPDTPPSPLPTRPARSQTQDHVRTKTKRHARPPRRPFGATRRSADRRPRGCPHSDHVLVRPAASPRPPPAYARGTGRLGRLAHAAGPLRAARPHRQVTHGATVAPGSRARACTQHGQPRVAPPRRPAPHLSQRLRRAALARQDPAHLRADRAGLQRASSAQRAPPHRHGRGDEALAGHRQDRARSPASQARRRLRTCTGYPPARPPVATGRRSPRAPGSGARHHRRSPARCSRCRSPQGRRRRT